MKVFITGGTGFIGSLVVEELIKGGHQVLGLARSEEAEKKLRDAGAEVLRGELSDTDILKQGAASSDGVIHLGFNNDFSNFAKAAEMDLEAIKAMGSVLAGTGKAFVNTGGTLFVSGLGRVATEEDRPFMGNPRAVSEEETIALAEKGVRASIVRLAPCVHDVHRQGFASLLAKLASEKGIAAYIGDGSTVWPAIHRRDAAKLFCLALLSAPAGARLHGAAEEGISQKEIAEAVGRNLNIPVKSISAEEAAGHFGWLAQTVALDNPASSAVTRKLLGWEPEEAGLIEDINSF